MRSNKIHEVFYDWVLFIIYISSTCFGPHRSIFRSVLLQAVCADFVCGNTCRVVRTVVTHTKSAHTACNKTILKMDQWGPKHVELTYVMNKTQSLKKNFMYLVGLHIYCYRGVTCEQTDRQMQTWWNYRRIFATFSSKVKNAMLPFHSGWNLLLTLLWRGKRVIGRVNNGDCKDWFENV